jgi:glyoxylase-like metal-dependent hydrolase (beta-lactamase superfamily II)
MGTDESYEIYALRYAERTERTRQENFKNPIDDHDSPMPMDYFVWLVRNERHTIVVDTGFGHEEARRRSRAIIETPREALTRLGVDCDRVEEVVVTHLHYDHAGTLADFPSARFHLQESEMAFATGRWMLDDAERFAYTPEHVCEMVHKVFERRVAFHAEDGEVAPGVTVHRMPGHTMGLQVVRVPTRRGHVVLASDATHYYENWTRRAPFSICWSEPDLGASYERLEQLADSPDHVVPGHDPLVRSFYRAPSSELEGRVCRLHEPPTRTLREAGLL